MTDLMICLMIILLSFSATVLQLQCKCAGRVIAR